MLDKSPLYRETYETGDISFPSEAEMSKALISAREARRRQGHEGVRETALIFRSMAVSY